MLDEVNIYLLDEELNSINTNIPSLEIYSEEIQKEIKSLNIELISLD